MHPSNPENMDWQNLPKSVGEEGNLVRIDFGKDINNPENKTKTYEVKDTYHEGNDILSLEVTNDSVNAGYDYADEDKDENLSDLGKALKGSSKRLRSHYLFSLCIISRIHPLE